MANIHFILQGKGGVGKSMIATMIYQAFVHHGKHVIAFDSDPINATLASFKEFTITKLDIMRDGNIEQRRFDPLLEALAAAPDGSHAIVDNGASSFIALGAYLAENDFLSVLEEHGHTIFLHTIITGGQSIVDTIGGLARLATGFPTTPIVVWLNPFFGEITADGKGFEEFNIYAQFSKQFHAVIKLPEGNKALIGRDLEELFAKRQSFETAINSSDTPLAVKARLRRYWNQILACVEQADLI